MTQPSSSPLARIGWITAALAFGLFVWQGFVAADLRDDNDDLRARIDELEGELRSARSARPASARSRVVGAAPSSELRSGRRLATADPARLSQAASALRASSAARQASSDPSSSEESEERPPSTRDPEVVMAANLAKLEGTLEAAVADGLVPEEHVDDVLVVLAEELAEALSLKQEVQSGEMTAEEAEDHWSDLQGETAEAIEAWLGPEDTAALLETLPGRR